SELNDTRMIYISTDSVFDGEKQGTYNEFDKVNPLNIYAKTKYLGEKSVKSINNGLILRVNIIGWTQKKKKSFAEMILINLIESQQLNLFNDVYFSPITVYDLSHIIIKIVKQPIIGIYHCGSKDNISKYDFGLKMAEIFQLADSNIKKISLDDMELRAIRPKNMALDVTKISKALNINLPGFEDSIRLMKQQYDNNKNLLN
ncbi:sugar nucleotide-binding protein, partial [Candidatus Pseudothioglobus singularis]|nr:sugar nucleotide-binding protein [Candidatus Pseudothioglobus singularis]